jgi:hypothetical protein
MPFRTQLKLKWSVMTGSAPDVFSGDDGARQGSRAGSSSSREPLPAEAADNATKPLTNTEEPEWETPGDIGRPAAFDTMSGVAAPLLAGFSLTLLGVVGQAPTSFRWPGAAMTVLTLVVALLVTCVQMGFRGRAVLYSRADVDAWRPLQHQTPDMVKGLAWIQRNDLAEWARWAAGARRMYNAGIVLLAGGVALVLLPPEEYKQNVDLSAPETAWRLAGAAVAVIAGLAELGWILNDQLKHRRTKRRKRAVEKARAAAQALDSKPRPQAREVEHVEDMAR